MIEKLKKIKLLKRKNLNITKQMKTFLLNDKTIYEGEMDQLKRPSGFGCMIIFNQDIKGIPMDGNIN
jgi:hypothetical protein